MLNQLITTHLELIADLEMPSFKRYIYDTIDWDSRLILLTGARGTGKTTLLLQYFKEKFDDPKKCLYIMGDDGDVLTSSLGKIAREFYLKGGQTLIIDEVHKYPHWSRELKNIYDKHPKLKVIASGSSTINIIKEKFDLSRRAVTYHLTGLSFREFLNLDLNLKLETYPLEKLIENHQKVVGSIKKELEKRDKKVLELFDNYLQYGFYPFFKEGAETFASKLNNALEKILYEDIPSAHKISAQTIANLKKLLYLIGASHPFQLDIAGLASNLDTSRNSVYEYLDYLSQADLLLGLMPAGQASRAVRKAKKLFLGNPNLYYVVGDKMRFNSEIGTVRETFAASQLSKDCLIRVPKKGDFLVESNDNTYALEVGGRNKDLSQVKEVKNGFAFCDDIEIGLNRKIPLYLLGFLY